MCLHYFGQRNAGHNEFDIFLGDFVIEQSFQNPTVGHATTYTLRVKITGDNIFQKI